MMMMIDEKLERQLPFNLLLCSRRMGPTFLVDVEAAKTEKQNGISTYEKREKQKFNIHCSIDQQADPK